GDGGGRADPLRGGEGGHRGEAGGAPAHAHVRRVEEGGGLRGVRGRAAPGRGGGVDRRPRTVERQGGEERALRGPGQRASSPKGRDCCRSRPGGALVAEEGPSKGRGG